MNPYLQLARQISIVENEAKGYRSILQQLDFNNAAPIVGITGPPGAGKSSLINALLKQLLQSDKKVAVIAVDPSSPFNLGALLGDRIRMARFFNHPNVFIRSLASRGSLGGLSEKIIEVSDVLRCGGFDLVIVETVGVGQSEVEIAGLADQTVLVLNPQSGDDIQIIKAGILEVADLFVVNKADLDPDQRFYHYLKKVSHDHHEQEMRIFKTSATDGSGVDVLAASLLDGRKVRSDLKAKLLAARAVRLLQRQVLRGLDERKLIQYIEGRLDEGGFHLYRFLENF